MSLFEPLFKGLIKARVLSRFCPFSVLPKLVGTAPDTAAMHCDHLAVHQRSGVRQNDRSSTRRAIPIVAPTASSEILNYNQGPRMTPRVIYVSFPFFG